MAKPKSLSGNSFIEGKPKKTRQGSGRHSLPKRVESVIEVKADE